MTKNSSVTEFKSGFIYTLRLILKTADTSQILDSVSAQLAKTGSLFEGESLVIDAVNVEEAVDWTALVEALTQKSFKVIGVSAKDENLSAAEDLKLPIIDPENLPDRKAPEPQPTTEPVELEKHEVAPAPQLTSEPTMVLNRQLRSGQRVYAKNADLIVIGSVSPGAEVIADGNIHIYGTLKGRAIAGARGNTSALIYVSRLDAELVAIAGIYQLIDAEYTPENLSKPVIIELDNESLIFKNP